MLTEDRGQQGLLVLVGGLQGGFFQTTGADAIQRARRVPENRVKRKGALLGQQAGNSGPCEPCRFGVRAR